MFLTMFQSLVKKSFNFIKFHNWSRTLSYRLSTALLMFVKCLLHGESNKNVTRQLHVQLLTTNCVSAQKHTWLTVLNTLKVPCLPKPLMAVTSLTLPVIPETTSTACKLVFYKYST